MSNNPIKFNSQFHLFASIFVNNIYKSFVPMINGIHFMGLHSITFSFDRMGERERGRGTENDSDVVSLPSD